MLLLSFAKAAAASREDPSDSTVLLGMGLTTAAGLATVIGALIVFYDKDQRFITNKKFLAGSLALSAGVMIYVSFAEMFEESKASFVESGESEGASAAYVAISLFGGMGICKLLDVAVHALEGVGDRHRIGRSPMSSDEAAAVELPSKRDTDGENSESDLESVVGKSVDLSVAAETAPTKGNDFDSNKRELQQMGLLTALAVALHNFPEGLATFVGTLDDDSVGISLAIAIAIHNIPEGIAVAMPIYYGTKNKTKAFIWALVSGLAEPFGAIIGYVALMDHFTDLTYGIVFGIVAGMMIYISFSCLLPTAFKYDPENEVTTTSLVVGMFVMALSIVLFEI